MHSPLYISPGHFWTISRRRTTRPWTMSDWIGRGSGKRRSRRPTQTPRERQSCPKSMPSLRRQPAQATRRSRKSSLQASLRTFPWGWRCRPSSPRTSTLTCSCSMFCDCPGAYSPRTPGSRSTFPTSRNAPSTADASSPTGSSPLRRQDGRVRTSAGSFEIASASPNCSTSQGGPSVAGCRLATYCSTPRSQTCAWIASVMSCSSTPRPGATSAPSSPTVFRGAWSENHTGAYCPGTSPWRQGYRTRPSAVWPAETSRPSPRGTWCRDSDWPHQNSCWRAPAPSSMPASVTNRLAYWTSCWGSA